SSDLLAHDGQRLAHAGVVGAKNYHPPRQIEAAIDSSRDVSRVHISGVGNNAAHGANPRSRLRRSIGAHRGISLNFRPEMLRVGGIEASCNGWLTNCGSHGAQSFAALHRRRLARTFRACRRRSLRQVYAWGKARNTAAVFSSDMASARTSARSPADFSAARMATSSY